MHITVDPGKFCDQKLELRSIGENDYRIVISNHTAGRIFRTARGSMSMMWYLDDHGPLLRCCRHQHLRRLCDAWRGTIGFSHGL